MNVKREEMGEDMRRLTREILGLCSKLPEAEYTFKSLSLNLWDKCTSETQNG